MRDIKCLDRLTYFLTNHKMPKDQNLFMNYEEYLGLEEMLSKFPTGVVIFKESMATIQSHSLTIRYNGYTFNIYQY